MTDLAPPPPVASATTATDILEMLEDRLHREVELFIRQPISEYPPEIEISARASKRLVDLARCLVALRTALVRLAQVAAGRRTGAPGAVQPQAAGEMAEERTGESAGETVGQTAEETVGEDEAATPAPSGPPRPANRAARRRAEALAAKAHRDLDRLSAACA